MRICIAIFKDTSNNITDFRILNDSKRVIRDISYRNLKGLLNRGYKIENIGLSGDKIVSTAGSFERYPVINTNLNLDNITILAKTEDNSIFYYSDFLGNIKSITREGLVSRKGISKLTNAKVVNTNIVSLGSKIRIIKMQKKLNGRLDEIMYTFGEDLIRDSLDHIKIKLTSDEFKTFNKSEINLRLFQSDQLLSLSKTSLPILAFDYYLQCNNKIINFVDVDDTNKILDKTAPFIKEYKITLVSAIRIQLGNAAIMLAGLLFSRKTNEYALCLLAARNLNMTLYNQSYILGKKTTFEKKCSTDDDIIYRIIKATDNKEYTDMLDKILSENK